ncbi:hypothetical protein HYW76_05005 [Candidatus Pacearchaeota archaeon]|nr:hypothetical protein [Candidatus Pacearchaeota archaeon]
MKRRGIFIIFIIAGIVIINLASASTNISISPENKIAIAGENVTFSIMINTNESIYAASFDLYFNSSFITGIDSSDGGFLGKDGNSVLTAVKTINNSAGKFSFAATRIGLVGGISGNGSLANIVFNVISNGSGKIMIENIQIANQNLQAVVINKAANSTLTTDNMPPEIIWTSPNKTEINFREGYNLMFKQISLDEKNIPLNYSWRLDESYQGNTQNWSFSAESGKCLIRNATFIVADESKNSSVQWNINISLRGDVNFDRKVDIFDLAAIGLSYRTHEGETGWSKDTDLNPKTENG